MAEQQVASVKTAAYIAPPLALQVLNITAWPVAAALVKSP